MSLKIEPKHIVFTKKLSKCFFRVFWTFCLLFYVQILNAQYDLWTLGTAKTIAYKEYETGLFSPLRYGISPRVEIGSYILSNVFCPNVRGKIHWFTIKKWGILVSTRHAAYFPTSGLNYIGRKDPTNTEMLKPDIPPPLVYSPEKQYSWEVKPKIPFIVMFSNDILLSKLLVEESSCKPSNLLLTLKLGLVKTFKKGESNMPVIDEPLLYHRTSGFRDTILWYAGVDLEGHVNAFFDFSVDADFLSLDWDVEKFAIEHKAMLIYPVSNFRIIGGYKFTFGEYPDGFRPFISPVFEITYHFKIRGSQDGLFKNDPYKRKLKLTE